MNAGFRCLVLLTAVLLLSSCLPEQRIWWSPKGDRALVLVDDRLHLVDPDGGLGAPLMSDASMERALVKTVSWLPDGTGFVCQRTRTISSWEEAKTLIPAEEAEAVEKMMQAVPSLLEAAMKLAGDSATPDDIASSLPMLEETRFMAALHLLYQRDQAAVEKMLLALPKGGDVVTSLKKDGTGFEVNELCVSKLDAARGTELVTFARSLLRPAILPRVSPKHDAVAFARIEEEEESATLEVMTLDGRAGFTVARNVSAAFDWMPDGRTLVFMAPIGGEGEKLQAVHRITVLQESGAMMKPRHERQADGSLVAVKAPDRLAEPATLATVLTLNRPVVQVLADGRVLFASQPVTLPATGPGENLESRLFVISADGKEVQPVPTKPGDLPTNLGWFVASPDGRRVAIVESETDAVAVVEVDTGRTQIISPPHPRWQCRTMPAWKSASELTFAGLRGEGEPKWMLWSEGTGVRCLNEKWPATATADWLERKNEESARESVPVTAKPDSPR